METHTDELASADSRDMGKPLAQCRHDVARAAMNFRFFADHAKMAVADTLPMDTGHHAYSRFEPAGRIQGRIDDAGIDRSGGLDA